MKKIHNKVVWLFVVVSNSAFAQATGDITGLPQKIYEIMTGDFFKYSAMVAIAAIGYAAFRGRIAWGWAVAIIAGIAIALNAEWVYTQIGG